jgi:hypothetical protein
MPCLVRGKDPDKPDSGPYCRYKKCPGLKNKKKTKRAYRTIYQCEQCTVEKGYDFWLCHTTKKIKGKPTIVSCHLRYHTEEICIETSTSAAESSVASELTDE